MCLSLRISAEHNCSWTKFLNYLSVRIGKDMASFMFLWMLFKIFHPVVAFEPVKKDVYIDGNIILGGFFPIHKSDNDDMCGELQVEGILELEAMLYAVESINKDKTILGDQTLGVLAVDSCDSVPYALERAVDFAKGFIVKEDKDKPRDKSLFMCEGDVHPVYENGRFEKVVAIVGGHSSWVSMQVADVMRIYKMPQVSYMSTNPALSDKRKYNYFFRTVPSLYYQTDALIVVMRKFNWRYVSVIYSDTHYGNNAFKDLKDKVDKYNKAKDSSEIPICFSYQKRINVENSKDNLYDSVIADLLKRNATAVIVLSGTVMAKNLLTAATRALDKDPTIMNRYVWIGSTAWVNRDYVTSGNERILEGAVGISHYNHYLEGFAAYWKSKHLNIKSTHPWFLEYAEETMKCRLKGSEETSFNRNYTECNQNVELPSDCYLETSPGVLNVINAVYSIAHALQKQKECQDILSKDCKNLRDYLQNVTFEDETGNSFHFDEFGDGPVRYNFINFQNTNDSGYKWISVGNFCISEPDSMKLDLSYNAEAMRFNQSQNQFPESFCSPPCEKKKKLGIGCCWLCIDCSEYKYVDYPYKEHKYAPRKVNPPETDCRVTEILPYFMSYSNSWAIACIAFSVIGLLMTIYIGTVFWKHWDTPIFVISGRELNCILLTGIFLMFTVTFAIVDVPSVGSCGIVRFFVGFCYTISYATLISKTHHIRKISEIMMSNEASKSISIKPMLLVILGLISVAVIINGAWMIHDPPDTNYKREMEWQNYYICKGSDRKEYLVGLVYPFFLMLFCTVYAFQNRQFSGVFYESRYINFANYTIFILWLAFLPIFILNRNVYMRVTVLSLLLNISASAQLVCLFFPKVYVALRRPEKNVHENIMCYDVRKSPANTSS